ncbi:sporulation membrane protein YtrI [Tuberibacillus sp. Marseille-P3662]|uniref:sporulation membrane protein YtrI n=1 Tax=Tuberibacillus sp. Marseille-P3662 TaxID=1965358 RepID=UPI000A1CCBEC|nr:sporulation membrane protein YtrI [Tuberibacillus sp. Marseille-P3662]
MRIPPYYRIPSWQRFLAGVIIGMFVGFAFFLVIFGLAQEEQINKIKKQETKIDDLERSNETLLKEKKEKNEKLEKQLTVQEINVKIKVPEKYSEKVSEITKYDLKKKINEQLGSLVNQDVHSVYTTSDLIYRSIEDKTFIVDDTGYQFEILNVEYYSIINVTVKISDVESTASTSTE